MYLSKNELLRFNFPFVLNTPRVKYSKFSLIPQQTFLKFWLYDVLYMEREDLDLGQKLENVNLVTVGQLDCLVSGGG